MRLRQLLKGFIIMAAFMNSSQALSNETLKLHFPKVSLILDPQKMEDAFSMTAVHQIFRGLLRFTPSSEIAPDLAKSWIISKNQLEYTFELAETSFSDGTAISASHVQNTFARMFYLESAMAADLDIIKGSEAFRKSKNIKDLGIEVLSPRSVRFTLKQPSALFLKHLAMVDTAILPVKKFDEDFQVTAKTSTSGPYKIQSFNEEKLELTKFRTDQMDSKIPPKSITFQPTTKTPLELAKSGDTDTLDHDVVPNGAKEDFLKKGWIETTTEIVAEGVIILNPNLIPDADRKNLFSAVDQEAFVKEVAISQLRPAFGVIPYGMPGQLEQSRFQKLKAKTEASKKPLTIDLEFSENDKIQGRLAELTKVRWEKLGYKVNLKPLPKSETLQRVFKKLCQACVVYKGIDYPDGFSVLGYFKSGYEANYFHLNDKNVDQLLNKALAESDSTKRHLLYQDIQESIFKHHTVIPLFFGSAASGLWSSKVKSVPPHAMGLHMLSFETIEMSQK